jgi:hypothetical protein
MPKIRRYTAAQTEYRNKLLKVKPRPEPLPPPQTTALQYLKNCIFWIEDYKAGGCSKNNALRAVAALKIHTLTIENEILNDKF